MNIFACDGSKSGPHAQNFDDSPLWLCLCETLWSSVVKLPRNIGSRHSTVYRRGRGSPS
jgi:hypothetical protein